MPELPEVETTVKELNKNLKGCAIKDLWTDWPKYFKLPGREKEIRKLIIGRKILNVKRRAKNILIYLSDGCLLLIHQKLSGHFLIGDWVPNGTFQKENKRENAVSKTQKIPEKWREQKWIPKAPISSDFWDEKNRFIRLVFFLSDKKMLALSDLRRFAKVLCGPEKQILNLPELKKLGPDPLDAEFTLEKLKELLKNRKGKVKQILMDQNFISGIGNIYADEILWFSKINPLFPIQKLREGQIQLIYKSIKNVLNHAVLSAGVSIDEYRTSAGRSGNYGSFLRAYQKGGRPCFRCGTLIKRIKISNRSAHYCPNCQKN